MFYLMRVVWYNFLHLSHFLQPFPLVAIIEHANY